jgi:hypothetical protein
MSEQSPREWTYSDAASTQSSSETRLFLWRVAQRRQECIDELFSEMDQENVRLGIISKEEAVMNNFPVPSQNDSIHLSCLSIEERQTPWGIERVTTYSGRPGLVPYGTYYVHESFPLPQMQSSREQVIERITRLMQNDSPRQRSLCSGCKNFNDNPYLHCAINPCYGGGECKDFEGGMQNV